MAPYSIAEIADIKNLMTKKSTPIFIRVTKLMLLIELYTP